MKNVYLTLFLIFVLVLTNCSNKIDSEKVKIKNAIKEELKIYPEERLIDLYKSYFQGFWGPGHLIPDSTSAYKYLILEMENAEIFDDQLWQPLAHYGGYFRMNLKFVRDSLIPLEEYLHAFIQSANNANKPELDDWVKEWSKVIDVIEENNIKINKYEEDKKLITDLLADGKYVVHHSDEFRDKYNPHYRVIAKEYFDKLMKKYIKR